MRRYLFVAWLLVAACFSQDFRGTISGVVTDSSSAPVAGAKVTVNEANTGTRVQITTDATGQYTALFLLPGDYHITAALEGFKEYLRKGIHLGAGEHPVIDPKLEIGNASESVSVTADAPLVLASLAIGV